MDNQCWPQHECREASDCFYVQLSLAITGMYSKITLVLTQKVKGLFFAVFFYYYTPFGPSTRFRMPGQIIPFFITSNWGSNQLWDNPPYDPLSCAGCKSRHRQRKETKNVQKQSRGDFRKGWTLLKEPAGVIQTVIDSHDNVNDSAFFLSNTNPCLTFFCTSGNADSPVISRVTTLRLID